MLRKLFAAALFVLASSPAFAASKMYISEYSNTGLAVGQLVQVASEPAITDQTPVDYSGGAASSAVFNASTNIVRVLCTSTCSIKFGTSPTATTSNKPLAAGTPEYFAVPIGQSFKISVIANTDF
jgi:hypothetical protein